MKNKLIKVQIEIPEKQLEQLLSQYQEKDRSKAIVRHLNERTVIKDWKPIPINRDPHNRQISDEEQVEIVMRHDQMAARGDANPVERITEWLNEKPGRKVTAYAVYAILSRKGDQIRKDHAAELKKRLGLSK